MVSAPSLTSTGRERIQQALLSYEEDGYDSYGDALSAELGAEMLPFESHVYSVPRAHNGQQNVSDGECDSYILKVCLNCLQSRSIEGPPIDHSEDYCFVEQESWVWHEAVRRGDEALFAPIIAADRETGWEVMEHCEPCATIDGVESQVQADNLLRDRFFERGWEPLDIKGDTRAFDGRLVAVDYEKVFPLDMATGLYRHSFEVVGRNMNYSDRSDEAIEHWRINGLQRA